MKSQGSAGAYIGGTRGRPMNPPQAYRPHTPAVKPLGLDWEALTPVCGMCEQRRGDVNTETGICAACMTPVKVVAPVVVKVKRVKKEKPVKVPRLRIVKPWREPSAEVMARRDAYIADAYAQGGDVTDLATLHTLTTASIYRIVRAAGVPLRPRKGIRKDYTATDIARAADLYRSGMGMREVGTAIGWSQGTVSRLFKANGIEVTREHHLMRPDVSEAARESMVTRYLAGDTAAEIGAAHGMAANSVTHILHVAGVTVRKSAESKRLGTKKRMDAIAATVRADRATGTSFNQLMKRHHVGAKVLGRILGEYVG